MTTLKEKVTQNINKGALEKIPEGTAQYLGTLEGVRYYAIVQKFKGKKRWGIFFKDGKGNYVQNKNLNVFKYLSDAEATFQNFSGSPKDAFLPGAEIKDAIEDAKRNLPVAPDDFGNLHTQGNEQSKEFGNSLEQLGDVLKVQQAITNAYLSDAIKTGEDALTVFKRDLTLLKDGDESVRDKFLGLGVDPSYLSPEVIKGVTNNLYNDLGALESSSAELIDNKNRRVSNHDDNLNAYQNKDSNLLNMMTGGIDEGEGSSFESGMPFFNSESKGSSNLGYLQGIYDSLTPDQRRTVSLDDLEQMWLVNQGKNVSDVSTKLANLNQPHIEQMVKDGGLVAPKSLTREEFVNQRGGFSSDSANHFARGNLSVNGMTDREGYGNNYNSLYNKELDEAIDRNYQQKLQAVGLNQSGMNTHMGLVTGASDWHTTHQLPLNKFQQEKKQSDFDATFRTNEAKKGEDQFQHNVNTELHNQRTNQRKADRDNAINMDTAILELQEKGLQNIRSLAELDALLLTINMGREEFLTNLLLKLKNEGRTEEVTELENVIRRAQGESTGWFEKFGLPVVLGLLSGGSAMGAAYIATGGKNNNNNGGKVIYDSSQGGKQ